MSALTKAAAAEKEKPHLAGKSSLYRDLGILAFEL